MDFGRWNIAILTTIFCRTTMSVLYGGRNEMCLKAVDGRNEATVMNLRMAKACYARWQQEFAPSRWTTAVKPGV